MRDHEGGFGRILKDHQWVTLWIWGTALFFLLSGETALGEKRSVQQLVSQGNALYLKGDFKEALAHYQQALLLEEDAPRKAKIQYNLGNTYYRLGELMNALKEYQEALRLNPNDNDSKFNLEVVLRALQGEMGILKGGPSEVKGGAEQEALEEEVRLILQRLERSESTDPRGLPVPPTPEEKSKTYKRDW